MSAQSQIQIRAEVDRNDIHVCRFTVDRPLHSGSASFSNAEEAKANGLADRLFKLPGVAKVDVDGYVVAVTQTGMEDWRQMGKRVGSTIRNFLNPPPEIPEGDRLPSEEVRRRVQAVLDEHINPGVGMHGVVGRIRNGPGPTIMLRTDLDALPVVERTGLPYASEVKVKNKDGSSTGVSGLLAPV